MAVEKLVGASKTRIGLRGLAHGSFVISNGRFRRHRTAHDSEVKGYAYSAETKSGHHMHTAGEHSRKV
jgi:hypothetical protein